MSYIESYEKFIQTFEVPEIEYTTPGRDWDDEGLASWYVETDTPNITSWMLFEFLMLYLVTCKQLQREPIFILSGNREEIECDILEVLIQLYNELPEEQKDTFKQEILDIIDDG